MLKSARGPLSLSGALMLFCLPACTAVLGIEEPIDRIPADASLSDSDSSITPDQSAGDSPIDSANDDSTPGPDSPSDSRPEDALSDAPEEAPCGSSGQACCTHTKCDHPYDCVRGTCQCPSGTKECNGRCIDTTSDSQNCGDCGNPCALFCENSSCVVVESASAGDEHTCASLSNGYAYCWGRGSGGELGTGQLQNDTRPQMVAGLTEVRQIQTGRTHSCARLTSGVIRCWGQNDVGQVGDGTQLLRPLPEQGPSTPQAIDLAVGGDHACMVDNEQGIWCWGRNNHHELGFDTSDTYSPVALQVNTTEVANRIACGYQHSCMINPSNTVLCWGWNEQGQLGIAQEGDHPTPQVVVRCTSGNPMLLNAVQVATGARHSCALRTDGRVFCWGDNSVGQLGDGTTTTRACASEVQGLVGAVTLELGDEHSCAGTQTGDLYCWGDNSLGQLGDGTQGQSSHPVFVAQNVAKVTAGSAHTCAVFRTGGMQCWGRNMFGQLGDGTRATRTAPVWVVWQ